MFPNVLFLHVSKNRNWPVETGSRHHQRKVTAERKFVTLSCRSIDVPGSCKQRCTRLRLFFLSIDVDQNKSCEGPAWRQTITLPLKIQYSWRITAPALALFDCLVVLVRSEKLNPALINHFPASLKRQQEAELPSGNNYP